MWLFTWLLHWHINSVFIHNTSLCRYMLGINPIRSVFQLIWPFEIRVQARIKKNLNSEIIQIMTSSWRHFFVEPLPDHLCWVYLWDRLKSAGRRNYTFKSVHKLCRKNQLFKNVHNKWYDDILITSFWKMLYVWVFIGCKFDIDWRYIFWKKLHLNTCIKWSGWKKGKIKNK